jgi:hypothetical protein
MSIFAITIYKTEAGVHTNPATNGFISTHCNDGFNDVPKKFMEVLLNWNAGTSQWDETLVFTPGTTIVALKIINWCDVTTAYINYGFNDFRLKGICCVNEQDPDDVFNDVFSTQFS